MPSPPICANSSAPSPANPPSWPPSGSPGPRKFGPGQFHLDDTQWLTQHGYVQWTSYQPASRYWPFQFIEGGWLLALSLLLIAATIWLIRRAA
jgi:hypothetical protein